MTALDGSTETVRARISRLDAARGFAAAYIFVHHAALRAHWGPKRYLVFGQVAVMLFFVISGFAIRLSSRGPSEAIARRRYVSRRVLRILPTLVIALIITWVARSLIQGEIVSLRPAQFAGNVAALVGTRPQWPIKPYLGNAPLWSLSYELWYYVAFFVFFLAMAARPLKVLRMWVLAVAVCGVVVAQLTEAPMPLYALLFVVWWLGVEFADEYARNGRVTPKGQRWPLTLVVVVVCLWIPVVAVWVRENRPVVLDEYPVTQLVQLGAALVVAVIALIWQRMRWVGFSRTVGFFRPLARISFGIYVFHYPLLQVAEAKMYTGQWITELLWVIPVTVGLAYLTDVRLHRRLTSLAERMTH